MSDHELRELDACIHREVMLRPTWRELNVTTGENRPCDDVLRYSTDIAAAWRVVSEIQRRHPGWRFSLLGGDVSMGGYLNGVYQVREDWRVPFGWRAEFFGEVDPRNCRGDRHASEHADTAPLAICLAALKAVRTPTRNP